MGLIRNLDKKILEKMSRKHIQSSPSNTFKSHSFVTMGAIGVPWISITLHWEMSNFISSKIVIFASLLFGLVGAILAFYEWRYFFQLRKSGVRKDKNLFFEESAGVNRKLFFYFSLFLYIVLQVIKISRNIDFQYMLRSDFYSLVTFHVFYIFSSVIVYVELSRICIPSFAKWSNKKHLFLVALISVIMIVLQTAVFSYLSGHSVI